MLIVDDDRDLVEMVDFALRRAGIEVLRASDGPTTLRLIKESDPDLVVLDVKLGAWNGFDILREVRRSSQVPVVMLTARDGEDDVVRGLELGADDYVTKPFSYRELVARIRAHIRRHRAQAPPATPDTTLQVGPLTLNAAEHTVTRDGHPLKLSATEFRLLHCLMQQAGTVVPTLTLLRRVWGHSSHGPTDLVRVTVYRLRRKVEVNGAASQLIHTVPGVGVMLKPSQGQA